MDKEKRSRGRPAKSPDELLAIRSVRLSDAQWAKVQAHGMDWLRALIDKAKPKPKE
jgi:hypothetical protein